MFGFAHQCIVHLVKRLAGPQAVFQLDNLRQLVKEPRIDRGQIVDFGERHSRSKRIANEPDAILVRSRQLGANLVAVRLIARSPQVLGIAAQAEAAHFQTTHGLLKRLLKRPTDGHRFADAFHLGRQRRVGLGKLFEGEPRDLRHHVVDRRFKTGHRLLSNIVAQFVQPIADRQLRRDLGDREARRLGGQRAGATDARVHLDDDHLTRLGVDRELDVRTARFDADFANHREARVAHPLIFLVGQRLGRSHRDRIARVDPHRIEILDRANDHDVVVLVAHHLHLVLFPTKHRLLDQHFGDRRLVQPATNERIEVVAVVGHRRSGSAHREAGAHDARQTDRIKHAPGMFDVANRLAAAHFQPNTLHRHFELFAFFGLGDYVGLGADHLDAKLFEHAVV